MPSSFFRSQSQPVAYFAAIADACGGYHHPRVVIEVETVRCTSRYGTDVVALSAIISHGGLPIYVAEMKSLVYESLMHKLALSNDCSGMARRAMVVGDTQAQAAGQKIIDLWRMFRLNLSATHFCVYLFNQNGAWRTTIQPK